MRRGRVEDGRGFDAEVAPFPIPAHQTGRADFPHPAFRQASLPGSRRHNSPPSPGNTASSDVFGSSRCCQAHRQSPLLDLFKSTPEARALPSTGITRLRQYYDPLRLPPGAHRRGYGAQAPPQWVSHVARITFATCRAHYLGGPNGCFCRSPSPFVLPSPVSAGRHPRLHFRGLLRLHARSAHRIARPPIAAFVTRLRRRRLPSDAARQLPVSSTIFWVESSSTGDTRLRGAPRRARSRRVKPRSSRHAAAPRPASPWCRAPSSGRGGRR